MINALLGIKKQMTSTYDARGRRVGATVVEIQPNMVTQVKTTETKDGYNAVQIGFGTKKSIRKPQLGHVKKAGSETGIRFIREVRVENVDVTPGQSIKAWDVFSKGDAVKVTGTSKGKGFQGGVRRHGFAGGPKTHGQSDRHRAPGSIGAGTTPGRVYKNQRMAGHMGNVTASMMNSEIISIDRQSNLVTIKGGIPGPIGGVIRITRLGRIKGYIAPPEPEVEEEEEESAAETQPEDQTAVESTENAESSEQSTETPAVEEPATENTEETSSEESASEEPAASEEVVAETSEEEKTNA